MVRSLGAQIGLLVFAVALIAGISAGNPVTVVLTRALIALVLGALLGQAAGWTAKLVLREYLQRQKIAIDHEHLTAIRALMGESGNVGGSSDPEQPSEAS